MSWTYHGGGAPAGSDNPIVNGNLTVTGDEAVGGNRTTSGNNVVTGNETIGGTLAVTGASSLAAVSASGAITPSQTHGLVGTTTNNNADAGSVGEFESATLASGSALSLANQTQMNIVTLSLTAGDWECAGMASFKFTPSTSYTDLAYGLSTTTGALGDDTQTGRFVTPAAVPGSLTLTFPVPITRFSLSATTTIYLVGYCTFTVSTLTVFGFIRARRVR